MPSNQLPIASLSASSSSSGDSASSSSVRQAPSKNGYWRSISELEQTPEFEQFVQREFPQAASEFPDGVSRRKWLKLMSASLALAGVAGCRYGRNEFAAFKIRPENTIPGVPRHYATNFELAGRAVHLLVSNVDGRPIKIEGNPDHPVNKSTEPNDISGGKSRFASAGTDVFSQGCILDLYDGDRTSKVSRRYEDDLVETEWRVFAEYCADELESLKANQGASLAVLMPPSLSPSVNRMVSRLVEILPEATVVQHHGLDDSGLRKACEQAAGQPAEIRYDLAAAQIICCLDSDLLGNHPDMLAHSRQFSQGRNPEPGKMNRLYAVESQYTVTGASADTRFPLRSSQVGAFIARLEKRVDELLAGGQPQAASEDEAAFDAIPASEQLDRLVEAMAEDLVANQENGLVSVGYFQPYEVQVAALRLNKKLGNVGKSVRLMPSRTEIPGATVSGVTTLLEKVSAGEVDHVWVLGGNPVYTAPSAVALADALKDLEHVVYMADFEDETAMASSWVLPLAHPLESWGDVLGSDGSYGICQPQILPLLGGKSACEILSIMIGEPQLGEQIVKSTADALAGGEVRLGAWRKALHDGFLSGVSSESLELGDVEAPAPMGELTPGEFDGGEVEVVFAASDTIYDGRFAKNVWLQELPQPMTKLVWDNAAIVSPQTAEKLGLSQGARTTTETVLLVKGEQQLELPVFIMPGQAAGAITVHLGYGRVCRDEAVDSDEQVKIGTDVGPLRPADHSQILTGVQPRATSKPYKLVTTQDHFAIDELGLEVTKERAETLVREGTLEQIDEGGEDFVEHLGTHHPKLESLWEEPVAEFEEDPTVDYQWGMTVDLNKCTGCNACVVACQAENNIPVVGKEQVSRGREMHWIRIDRYYRGDVESPKIVNQPVACVHCETAPCEQVCPVAATVHTEEGINAMAYNRCVGTRYCANNCPYKVRRFNYFNYNTEYGYFYGWEQRGNLEEASRKLQQLVLNPEVTVRGRGVMEKCTYCIQRVQNGKINARAEGRGLEDGEVQTACQTACPTQAIVFGNLKDSGSRVSQLQQDPRAYAMLAELNIKPRTLYLARVRNMHPRLKTEDQLAEATHGHGESHASDHGSSDHGDDHAGEHTSDH